MADTFGRITPCESDDDCTVVTSPCECGISSCQSIATTDNDDATLGIVDYAESAQAHRRRLLGGRLLSAGTTERVRAATGYAFVRGRSLRQAVADGGARGTLGPTLGSVTAKTSHFEPRPSIAWDFRHPISVTDFVVRDGRWFVWHNAFCSS